ncbi:MAG TPA: hypothetical protein ENL07_07260 [Chlorobaculum parvum]|uniref:Tetratricopeptide repeat protein n=1 Tax=Chlorobaculum parvum TaxID=274539 RepID=A0A7C5DEJ4_9CHLB|nr:hypothetical protein [Chlorobaculum parvum]
MKQRHFSFRLAFLLALFTFSLAACDQQEPEPKPSELYEEARRLEGRKRYSEALDLYNCGVAADTLNGFSAEALEALCRKGRVEYLTGCYDEAFRTWKSIETHAEKGKPGDSLRVAAGLDTAQMYAELGRYDKAALITASIGSADAWQRYQTALYHFKSGKIDEASQLYQKLSASSDPAVRMVALSGLLDCSLAAPATAPDTPKHYAAKIAAVSAKVMRMNASSIVKIRTLRIAAKSLLQLESQQRNASYLLFRALAIAQEKGLSRLVPILQYEANAVIVRKPDTYRNVIAYFGSKNMQYAKAAALCKLGACKELTPAERITALHSALTTCQYYGIPATATGYLKMVRDAARQLDDLLIASGRFVELFDVSGQEDALEIRSRMQAAISEFRLPAGHEALQNEIISVTTDISGLLQRKIDMNEQGEGFRYAALIDKSITEKQGRLIGFIAETSKIDRQVASNLQPEPLTLNTLRNSLQPDEALVRFFTGDSGLTVIMVSNREMQIETSPVTADELRSLFQALLRRTRSIETGNDSRLLSDQGRIWLTDSLLKTMSVKLASYRHLIFVSDQPQPFHLLGRGELLGRGRGVTYLISPNEAAISKPFSGGQDEVAGIEFFNANREGDAQIYKFFHPTDRVILSWKPLSDREIRWLKTAFEKAPAANRSAAGFLKLFGGSEDTEKGLAWFWLGAYGLD